MTQGNKILAANQQTLRDLVELINLVGLENYTACAKPGFESSIGQHVRHVIEHYRCFFEQLPSAVICYDERIRQIQLELDGHLASTLIETELTRSLLEFPLDNMPKSIELCDMLAGGKVVSSVGRELVFLQSHATHHIAMIAAMARFMGFSPKQNVGIAAATLDFMERYKCAQ